MFVACVDASFQSVVVFQTPAAWPRGSGGLQVPGLRAAVPEREDTPPARPQSRLRHQKTVSANQGSLTSWTSKHMD